MNRGYHYRLFHMLVALGAATMANAHDATISSPDGHITVQVWVDDNGSALYSVLVDGNQLIDSASLGVEMQDVNFKSGLYFAGEAAKTTINDRYELKTGKRKWNHYLAHQCQFKFRDRQGKGFDVVFRVSDDGVAFRYYFPYAGPDTVRIVEEHTSFRFPGHAKGWLQPMAVAKSGWEQTNPSYEEHYQQGLPVGTPESTGTGWVYPALFQVDSLWVLITEAGLDGRYCATRLGPESPQGEYRIGFPDPREVMPGGELLPASDQPFYSPWRVMTIGSLATLVESNLGINVADPAIPLWEGTIRPGKSSWSWINSKDDFITYEEQKKYIDFAADMQWQYCLVDVNWDRKIGYERIAELASYAAAKGVGLLLWYNSAGSWNTVEYTPKDKLLTPESRESEFARLNAMGIKGIKIDFFGGDGQSVVRYYIDILKDAARHGLLVNFHGATLPRGWSRTYPNLMTVEAVRGFEMVTFSQEDADKQATHCTILPFTRNAFDPMDYTPMNLHKVQTPVQRRTTAAFELATSILFVSGIQHYAESPEGMATVPGLVRDFLRELPDSWDDVKFIGGFPGKDVVIARRAGHRWYVAGINGEQQEKDIHLDLTLFGEVENVSLITDGVSPGGLLHQELGPANNYRVTMKSNGGFVMVLNQ
ncbi:Glycosyl-hydrolase 97 C-terminal, oligomerisation [Parapedobacter composti]|uniref:Glycosyl-hydrolase 97 C-terminal, oligomerisation n=1 Tax=Parapedobacter composti TaxID=623281 RepID=A0A1I1DXB6_9SPHI|nr:glycoside hydrolase family 97 protein [Parapedobacter composti]SFB79454.1 Glycosyl-hydrolase 97 C-terminal, oligomerisation [Parapedobacter composti]